MAKIFVFKVVVIGDPAVGKTSLITRFSEEKFEREYKPTLGANILIKDLTIDTNQIKFLLFDIAGQMKWDEIRQLYYKGAQAAIMVYDVTRPNTLKSIEMWHGELLKNAGEVPKVLLANKVDLEHDRKTSQTDGEVCASELKCPFFETSALTGTRVNDAFYHIATKLLNDR